MKHLAKLMLLTLGIGVVAVVVSFLPRLETAVAADPPLPPNSNSLPCFGKAAPEQPPPATSRSSPTALRLRVVTRCRRECSSL